MALAAPGCAVKRRTVVTPAERRPALEATPAELAAVFNHTARGVRSLNAAIEMHPVAGTAYTGVIEEYREVRGFILAQRPAHVRLIGQAPVVATNLFDMVSDGETFRIHIPPRNRFLVGPARLERASEKPIENLRPQHLLEALFWDEVDTRNALWEEFDTGPVRYYILTEVRRAASRGNGMELARKIWFDRADLTVTRVQIFDGGARPTSDVSYADWQRVAAMGDSGPELPFPRQINVYRPHEDYRLDMRVLRITLNETISAERFHLAQPPGAELVRVESRTPEGRP